MYSRREFVQMAFAGIAAAGVSPRMAWAGVESVVRGVKIGITSGSLNPLPAVAGRDRLDVIIDQCVQLGVGNVELASGFFGPGVQGGAVGGQAPATMTPEYQKSREALRQWRLSPASLDDFRAVRGKFDAAGIDLFSISNTFADDCTDAEIDAMFRQMQTLKIAMFQSNQTRMSMAPRLVRFAEQYKIRPSFHTHAESEDPNEIASPASLEKLMSLSKDFRICLDLGHYVAGNNDPVAALRNYHDRITHLHIKDRKRDKGANVQLGTGDTPIRECLAVVRDNKYPIICILEREFRGTGSGFDETKWQFDYVKRALES